MPRGMLLPEAEAQEKADDLDLYISNQWEHYKVKVQIFKNLWIRYRKGVFDEAKASKAFSYLTDKAAREWNNEYAAEYGAITTQARRIEDKDLVKEFLAAAKNREYDFMR